MSYASKATSERYPGADGIRHSTTDNLNHQMALQLDPRLAEASSHEESLEQPYYAHHKQERQQHDEGVDPALENSAALFHAPSIEYAQAPAADHHQSDSPAATSPNDPKRPRACEACRGLKVRCDQDPDRLDLPCKRCAKAGRPCAVTAPSRKRQKKADSRVAELEKKIDALTASLHAQGHGTQLDNYANHAGPAPPVESSYTAHSTPNKDAPYPGGYENRQWFQQPGQPFESRQSDMFARPGPPVSPEMGHKRRRVNENQGYRTSSSTEMNQPGLPPVHYSLQGSDANYPRRSDSQTSQMAKAALISVAVDESEAPGMLPSIHTDSCQQKQPLFDHRDVGRKIDAIMESSTAERLFDRFVRDLLPQFPAVTFSENTTAYEVRTTKPVLFLSILGATSFGLTHTKAQHDLAKEIVSVLADCVVRNGEKSLELIQALQVSALWYKPPEHSEQTNFYQLVHMAAVMAIDLGLGKRFNPSRTRRGFAGFMPDNANAGRPFLCVPNSDTIECRRAWLTCYFFTSMILRRPNLIRWTNYMAECIEVLETSPGACSSDKLLCQHVRIQHICEEIGSQFSMDDPSATIAFSDPKVTYAISIFEKQLKEWKAGIPSEVDTPALHFSGYVASLYLHEIAMHVNHNVDDFRLPFTEESLKSGSTHAGLLTPQQIGALEACLTATHGIINTFLSLGEETIRILPMLLYFVRVIYAVVILVKMYFAVTNPASELGKVLSKDSLKVEEHLEDLLAMFRLVATDDQFRPQAKILKILGMLQAWFLKHKDGAPSLQRESSNTGIASTTASEQKPRISHADARDSQQQGSYTSLNTRNTPLHLLSEVAMSNNNSNDARHATTHSAPQTQGQPPAPDSNGWYGNVPPMVAGQMTDMSMTMPGLDPSLWGSGFEQAMDMTLGVVDGDFLSSVMGDPMFFTMGIDGMGTTAGIGQGAQIQQGWS
ncbi:hypothetical protein BJ546DRAFT_121494 [Cryomyces antarcticus]